MEAGERIRLLRKKILGLTLDEFGNRLGVKGNTLSTIENGKGNVTDQMRKSICREFNVSENWLLTGEGEPFLRKSLSEEISDFMKDLNYEDSFKTKLISLLARMTPDEWALLEKMVRKLANLDAAPALETKSTEELEEIYKKEVLSNQSKPGVTA